MCNYVKELRSEFPFKKFHHFLFIQQILPFHHKCNKSLISSPLLIGTLGLPCTSAKRIELKFISMDRGLSELFDEVQREHVIYVSKYIAHSLK